MSCSTDDRAAFFDTAPCGLLLLGPDYEIRHANAYAEALVGAAPGALAGRRLQQLLTPASRIFLQSQIQPQLALGGRVDELVLDLTQDDGGRVPVMLNATQATDADGQPGVIRLAIWRAAAKRAYEAEVPKARQAAETASRIKADFLANVSHEIRTPLNGIIGVAELLTLTDLDPRQKQLLELIQSSGETAVRLVSDILDISRVQGGTLALELKPFDLAAELGGVLQMARLRAEEKGLELQVEGDLAASTRVLGDAIRLKQILTQLTANAVKFTDAGEVRVRLDLEPDYTLRMQVADTGVGFDPALADELFAPFEQAETGLTRRFGGAGLGLPICKALVELMGGAITVESRPGEGSVFTVTIPLAAAEQPQAPGHDAGEPHDGALRILLVEDNPTNQRVVQMILENCEVELEIAENGRLGLDAWLARPFDLVLMDLQMPVMDGLTAIREIRRLEGEGGAPARVPIAVLSANAMDHHQREALDAGADLHLAKPITASGLIAGIQSALQLAAAA